jgi:hypothetical protein
MIQKDLYNKIQSDYYKNKLPYPHYNDNSEQANIQWKAVKEEDNRLNGEFVKDLYETFGVTNNPKANKAYALAYDYGHSSGYSEIFNYFADLVELIR